MNMQSKIEGNHVVIVGGGPVGSLNACYLAKRGFKVDLYESRDDIREVTGAAGRSINLALSCRGIEALKHIGLDELVISLGVPMHGRMIHLPDGRLYPIPYGKTGQYLLSVDRLLLNQHLLTAASFQDDINIHFNHKLVSCDIEKCNSVFKKRDGSEVTVTSSAIFGCDGAYSTVRRQLQRSVFDYSQEFVQHGYKELTIPPTKNGEYAMAIEYLHIWPRHDFMLIALPNLDKSFTCTMLMPFSKYESLTDENEVIMFFNDVFPDVVPLIGEEVLRDDFFALPPLPMVSVKCSPYHHKSTIALFGDAAHAMVPFFGQGLNAGLEDVLIFDGIMEKHKDDLSKVLPEYSQVRCRDGQAIADLSKANYIEMRSSVVSIWFLFRKKVDNFIAWLLPSVFIPKYTMVAFTRTPYHQVVLQSTRNNKIINCGLLIGGISVAALALFVGWRYHNGNVVMPSYITELLQKYNFK